jgi:hypothetical protein
MSSDQNGSDGARRGTRPGSIRQVRLRLWWAIQEATTMLDQADPDTKLRAVSAISTACGAYANLTKVHSLETELQEARRELDDIRASLGRPPRSGAGARSADIN